MLSLSIILFYGLKFSGTNRGVAIEGVGVPHAPKAWLAGTFAVDILNH